MAKYLYIGVVLAVIMAVTPVYGDTNIVQNPGFENGTEGWDGRGCEIEAVDTPVHDGTKSAKASGRTDAWQGIKQSLIGKIENGMDYKITAWVRLENSDSDTVTISIEQNDDNGVNYININSGMADNSDWVEISGEWTPDIAGEATTLDVYVEGPAEGINFFVDDVSVTEVAAAAAPSEPNKPAEDKPKAPEKEPDTPKEEPDKPAKDVNEAKGDSEE
jgi:hypothetical protein